MSGRLLIFSILFIGISSAKSQGFDAGIGGGIMNYLGDLQSKRFTFHQSQGAISLFVKYEFPKNIVARAAGTFGSVYGDDKFNSSTFYLRGLNFRSNISEFQVGLEYHLLDMNTHRLSPYILGGLGVFHFDPYTNDTAGAKVFLRYFSTEGEGLPKYPNIKPYALTQINIPFGAGIEYRLNDFFSVGAELTERKLFTDYLDDVSGSYIDYTTLKNERGPLAVRLAYRGTEPYDATHNITLPRGNPKSKDWYYTAMFTIIYHFNGDSRSSAMSGEGGLIKKGIIDCPRF